MKCINNEAHISIILSSPFQPKNQYNEGFDTFLTSLFRIHNATAKQTGKCYISRVEISATVVTENRI